LPSTRPHSQRSLMGLRGHTPIPQQVGHLRCGASGSVDPLFQYKPTQLPPPSRAPSSRSLQRSLQSSAVDSGRVNTPIHSASATSPMVSDPMSPTLYEEKFINQGIAAYFNGKIPPYFRFDTRSIDRMACHLWESQMMRSPSTHGTYPLFCCAFYPLNHVDFLYFRSQSRYASCRHNIPSSSCAFLLA